MTGYSDFAKIGANVTINGDLERAKNMSSDEKRLLDFSNYTVEMLLAKLFIY